MSPGEASAAEGHGAPRLRYFDCRSRGQALRFALVGTGTPFEDERVALSELSAFRAGAHRPEVGGPFGSLPVLTWHGHTIAQTLPIASFLATKLGTAEAAAGPEARARLEMVASAAHLDMQVPYSLLLWLPADCTPDALRARARGLLQALVTKTGQLGAVLRETPGAGPFFGGREPALADYFVYEALSRACDVFAGAYEARLAEVPALAALRSAIETRPLLAAYRGRGGVPYAVTASPSERALRERLLAESELGGEGVGA